MATQDDPSDGADVDVPHVFTKSGRWRLHGQQLLYDSHDALLMIQVSNTFDVR